MISGLSPSVSSVIQTASAYASQWRSDASGKATEATEQEASDSRRDSRSDGISKKANAPRVGELSDTDRRQLEALKSTDRAVRAHEAAHMAAGGSLVTSGASFSFETGPDGQRYAVAGEVGIDTSKGRTPEETLVRAQQIRAAALAPADPSGQDRSVAAAAAQMAADARAEIARNNMSPAPQERDASRGPSFGQAIERSLNPNGRAVDTYA